MKIVINKCYGGFGLSHEAVLELIKMNSPLIRKWTEKEYFGNSSRRPEKLLDFGDGFKAEAWLPTFFSSDGFVYTTDNDHSIEFRTHPDLIAVVEELGDKANGTHAALKIINIPMTDVYIDEYDGMEKVNQNHASWE